MTGWIREINRLLPDKLIHLQVVVASSVERREPDDHFIGKYSKGPPVYREAVAFLIKNLRCKVLWSSTK
jgi:hypothetical protein